MSLSILGRWLTLGALMGDDRWARATRLILLVSVVLRLALLAINPQSNDDHLAVIQAIAYQGHWPERNEMFQAYHPKLYHGLVGVILGALPRLPLPVQIGIGNLVNGLVGIAALGLVYHFLAQLSLSNDARLLIFALVALHPRLISINSQVTNDTFGYMAGLVAAYCGYRLFKRWTGRDFIGLLVASILGALSKGSLLVIFIAVVGLFCLALLYPQRQIPAPRSRLALALGVYSVVFLACVIPFGPYWKYYQTYGSPFVINLQPNPLPFWSERTYYARPGTISMVDTYFTFRLTEMLDTPTITQDARLYPLHRTSLWSQVYGRLHFLRFDQWPPSWQDTSPWLLNLGRVLLILGLFPTAVLLVGLVRQLALPAQWLTRVGQDWRPPWSEAFLLLFAFGYLGMLIQFNLIYRDFASMKDIYLLPGVLGFVWVFAEAMQRLYGWLERRPRLRRLANGALVSLLVFYVADTLALIVHLIQWDINYLRAYGF